MPFFHPWAAFLVAGCAFGERVVLSNLELPVDTDGNRLITGEAYVLQHAGAYYFYFNNWGGCKGNDCCDSEEGCASCCYVPSSARYPDSCIFAKNHSVVAYRSTDLQAFEFLGDVLGPNDRPEGIEFRPHVVFNEATQLFVMWFEDRPSAIQSAGYAIATSTRPEGPFATVTYPVAVADVPGDFDILVDDDGQAYHVQTTTNDPQALNGFAITKLDATYTKPTNESVTFEAPLPAEGPVFFKRAGVYYIFGGTTCCACRGGSSIYVFSAAKPMGPWSYHGDIGSVDPSKPLDPHSPDEFTTRAQGSAVFTVGDQFIWLGNQWITSGQMNSDLLYWAALAFGEDGPGQITWQDELVLEVPKSASAITILE